MKASAISRVSAPQILLAGILFSVLMGALVVVNPVLGLAPLALWGAFIIIRFPAIGLYALFIGVFSLDWLSRVLQILPSASRYLTDVILALLLVAAVGRLLGAKKLPRRTPIDAPVLALMLIGVFSAMVNGNPLLLTLAGFRTLFKPLLLFYIVVNLTWAPRTLRYLIYLLVALELVQIPIMLVQVSLYGGGGDLVTGTFGYYATGIVTIVTLTIMALLYGQALTQAENRWRAVLYGLLGASLFIPVILSEAKAGFLIAPFMLLALFSDSLIRYLARVRTWLILLLFAAVFFAGVQVMPAINPRSQLVQFLQSPTRIITDYDRPLDQTNGIPASRLGDLQFAWQLVTASPLNLVFGFGPAQSVETTFLGVTGELRQTHDLGIFLGFHQFSRTLLEWGIAGLFAYLFAIWAVYRAIRSRFKRGAYVGFWRGVAWSFGGVTILYVLGTYYLPIWETEATAYLFWVLAASLLINSKLPQTNAYLVNESKRAVGASVGA